MNKLILDLDGTLWETKDSYLYAYDKLVKDLRTGYETGNTIAMFNGELLDEFIKSFYK